MNSKAAYEIDTTQRRLGPIWLTSGVTPLNVCAGFFCGMMTIVFVTSLGLLLPYLLHAHLEMPIEVQGNFTGNLTLIAEFVALGVVITAGTLSDRLGRRAIYVTGFLILFASFMIFPLVRSPGLLIAVRVLAAIGISSSLMMLASVIADYAQNVSRGKLISANGVCTGIGVVLIASLGFAQLTEILAARGFTPTEAGTYTYWIVGASAFIAALVAAFGLRGGRVDEARRRPPLPELLRTGSQEIRGNPRLSLACLGYFVSRGDLAVFVFFFSLWVVAAGTDAGVPVADAQATAGRLFGISQLAMLLFTPIMGIIVDRFDRVTALAIAMAVATVGYLLLGLVGNPFETGWIYPVAVLAGAGEACVIVSGPALVGQEARAATRGSVIGMVGFFGTLGVLIHSKVSGMLFDGWMYQAPFIYMGVLNAVVCAVAIGVRVKLGSSKAGLVAPQQT